MQQCFLHWEPLRRIICFPDPSTPSRLARIGKIHQSERGSSAQPMFEQTVPADQPALMRLSAFHRQRDKMPPTTAEVLSTRHSRLGESLMQDLMRFQREGRSTELLEVLAACVRHGRNLLINTQLDNTVLSFTVYPNDGQVRCELPMAQLFELPLDNMRVLDFEPPLLRPAGDPRVVGAHSTLAPLAPLLWELALRGSREELLPEIAGTAAYRISPGGDLRALDLSGSMAAAVLKLQRQTSSLREIASWPGFDRERAMRMLNGLYLMAALMISRSHPAATNDNWLSAQQA